MNSFVSAPAALNIDIADDVKIEMTSFFVVLPLNIVTFMHMYLRDDTKRFILLIDKFFSVSPISFAMVEPEKLPQHRHCGACGKAHTEDGRFCNDKCRESKKGELTGKKRQLFLIWAVFAVITVVAIWSM